MDLAGIRAEIAKDPSNADLLKKGYLPVYSASTQSKIVIIAQAPSRKAQSSGIPWNDVSGDNLRHWLGVTKEQFYDDSLFALLPVDFYYPGKAKHGDLPPRKDFAPLWHARILELMPEVRLTILIGQYAQRYYLKERKRNNLTETVRAYKSYLPRFFPLVHPSPLTGYWQSKNEWYEHNVLPFLRLQISKIIS